MLGPLVAHGVIPYQDDIIIYAFTFDEDLSLYILDEHDLTLKESKCAFGLREVPIMGHVVSAAVSEKKKSALDAVRFPKSNRELRRFLGFTNYMRSFIPNYSVLSKPLSSHVNVPPSM